QNDTDTSSCGDYDEEVLCDSNTIAQLFPGSSTEKVGELGPDDETPETVVDEPSGSTADELDETINPVPLDDMSEEIRLLKSNIQELQDLLKKKDDVFEKAESSIRELTRKLKRA